jgi:hypothetical protein
VFLLLVLAVVVVGSGRDRRFNAAIDGHRARTGLWPTLTDLSRAGRSRGSWTAADVAAAGLGPVWWQLDCTPCDLTIQVPGTTEQIEAWCDWHNRTHHGPSAGRAAGGGREVSHRAA